MKTYDRYSKFRHDDKIDIVPFGKIPVRDTDVYEYYIVGKTRLDLLSYKHYGNCNYGWLIMQANPEFGSMEFNIPNGSRLRIPYPLSDAIMDYQTSIDEYYKINLSKS